MSPTHACPLRVRWRCSEVHAGVSSLRLWNGSTNTAPLNCPESAGRRTSTRVMYGASASSTLPSGSIASDVPARNHSSSTYPSASRSTYRLDSRERGAKRHRRLRDRDRPGHRGHGHDQLCVRARRRLRHGGFPSTRGLTVFRPGEAPRWCPWPKTRHRARCACLLAVRRSHCSVPRVLPRSPRRARATPGAPRAEMGGGADRRRLRPRPLP